MPQIENITPEAFHADLLVPLKRANMRRGTQYFTLEADPAMASYWQQPASRSGGIARAEASALDDLAAFWQASGEVMLPRIIEELRALQASILANRPVLLDKGTPVSDFVYPLY
ncbi:MAG: hypothetical protein NT133_00475 [Alphaproteobacteria bacterium]|nr:hypothetical protein [Alphaproteobacteria bacterium]